MSPLVSQYGFFVDSDACSGCKTCQIACKDKNDLKPGVLWRRVYEITAGGWLKKDGIWVPTVTAYHLSLACHHCLEPACAPACSTQAIWKRDDGIVLIDRTRCTVCRACLAACPYSAIRYDAAANAVTKCDYCLDEVGAGGTPACVAACPNRALDFGDLAELRRKYGDRAQVFPLPDPGLAKPALVIRPHRSADAAEKNDPEVSNWGEL